MQSGHLYTPITIEVPQEVGHEYGGSDLRWTKLYDTRALELHQGGRFSVERDEMSAASTVRFVLHYYHAARVQVGMRVRRGEEVFRIEDVEANRLSKTLTLYCERNNE